MPPPEAEEEEEEELLAPVPEENAEPRFLGYGLKDERCFLNDVPPSEPVELEIQPAFQRQGSRYLTEEPELALRLLDGQVVGDCHDGVGLLPRRGWAYDDYYTSPPLPFHAFPSGSLPSLQSEMYSFFFHTHLCASLVGLLCSHFKRAVRKLQLDSLSEYLRYHPAEFPDQSDYYYEYIIALTL